MKFVEIQKMIALLQLKVKEAGGISLALQWEVFEEEILQNCMYER